MSVKTISEVTRVAKTPGVLYPHKGIDEPGIADRYIAKALRMAYQEDSEFKKFIDTIDCNTISNELEKFFKLPRL